MRTTTLPHNDWDSKEMAPVARLVVLDMATVVLYVRMSVLTYTNSGVRTVMYVQYGRTKIFCSRGGGRVSWMLNKTLGQS